MAISISPEFFFLLSLQMTYAKVMQIRRNPKGIHGFVIFPDITARRS
jgi:hypothetical protein